MLGSFPIWEWENIIVCFVMCAPQESEIQAFFAFPLSDEDAKPLKLWLFVSKALISWVSYSPLIIWLCIFQAPLKGPNSILHS